MTKYSKYIEETRPTMYRTMKYWGKKPHNVWRQLILENSNKGDIVFDPFSGSAITFFESIKIGRTPIVCDINPISEFLVDVYSQEYNIKEIEEKYKLIEKKIKNLEGYKKNYLDQCSKCNHQVDIYNFRWVNNTNTGYSYRCNNCSTIITTEISKQESLFDLKKWKPSFDLNLLSTISPKTIKDFGGSNITNLWTNRNIEILSCIFDIVINFEEPYKKIFTLAFLETIHLTTKMCALRSSSSNRPLSTSWGRPAYMALSNWMEQNPIVQLERSIFGKNGIINAINNREKYLPKYNFTSDMNNLNSTDYNGFAFTFDSKKLNIDRIVDMIIADPPYGDVIQYGELSIIWNVWLERAYRNYNYDLKNEVIINKTRGYDEFETDMFSILSKCHRLLKNDGVMILTFNSNSLKDWISINNAIKKSGFLINDYYLQNNLRSSEANVSSKTGISISDYYLKLTKSGVCISDEMIEELTSKLKRDKND